MPKNKQDERQMDLIKDLHGKEAKKILKIAKDYKAAQKARLAALEEEKAYKQGLLALIKDAGIKPLDDGTIKFSLDGYTISVKPRDELIQVRETAED
jgi:hypothetical protein